MLTAGVPAGLLGGLVMSFSGHRMGMLCLACAIPWCLLVVLAEGVAGVVRPPRRALVMTVFGFAAALVAAFGYVWVTTLLDSWDVALARGEVVRLVDEILRKPVMSLGLALTALLPFVLLGTARSGGWPFPAQRLPLWSQVGLGLIGCVVAYVAFAVLVESVPFKALPFFTLPAVAPLGLVAGERAEAAFLARRSE